MAEIVQVCAAILVIPFICLAILAWTQVIREPGNSDNYRSIRLGAVVWTAGSLLVAGLILSGELIPDIAALAMIVVGAGAGVILARAVSSNT